MNKPFTFFGYRFRDSLATLLLATMFGCAGSAMTDTSGSGGSSFFDPGTWGNPAKEADSRLITLGISLIFLGAIAFAVGKYADSKDLIGAGIGLAAFGIGAIVLAVLLKPLVWLLLIGGVLFVGYTAFIWLRKRHYKSLVKSKPVGR